MLSGFSLCVTRVRRLGRSARPFQAELCGDRSGLERLRPWLGDDEEDGSLKDRRSQKLSPCNLRNSRGGFSLQWFVEPYQGADVVLQ